LGCKIYHDVESVGSEKGRHRPAICQVTELKRKIVTFLQKFQTIPFKGNIIIIVQIVDAHNDFSDIKQSLCEVKPNKSGDSGNEYFFHENSPPKKRGRTSIFDSHEKRRRKFF
jgi:hypothetical protein